jgi:hypothetical protein
VVFPCIDRLESAVRKITHFPCDLYFEKEERTLKEGELCILAPMSLHNIRVEDEASVIIVINIRKSTFDRAFFTLLTHKDLLSYFFKTILYNQTSPNYLLFTTFKKYYSKSPQQYRKSIRG